MDTQSPLGIEIELRSQIEREDDRRARALAVACVFDDRAQTISSRLGVKLVERGGWSVVGEFFRQLPRVRAMHRRERAYHERLGRLPDLQLSDAGLARFIFGHNDLGPRAPAKGALSPAHELWEALDRLIAECHRQKLQPSLTLTAAMSVRGRLRALGGQRP